MKTRLHHKVGQRSIYHNPVLDAPWPLKDYFVRLGLFGLELISLAVWCSIPAFIDAAYVSGWGSLWEKISPLVFILGFGFVMAALILSINPCAIKLSAFKGLLSWTSPPGFVWKVFRLLWRMIRPILLLVSPWLPLTRYFFRRFVLLCYIGLSLICWNIVPYLIHLWLPFSRDRWYLSIVIEVIALVPAALIVSRLLDQTQIAKEDPYRLVRKIDDVFPVTNVVVLVLLGIRGILILGDRIFRGRNG